MIGSAQAINQRPTASRVTRKWLVLFLVLQAALWTGVMLWAPPAMRGPLKVAVGLWPGTETLTIARERGILNGEKVSMIEMTWSSAAMRAFGNGVVDAAVLSLDETLRLRQNGHDVRVVLIMDVSAGADSLLAKGAIRKTGMLRGRPVGVELRTAGTYLLAKALEREGLTLNDVKIVPLNLAETESALMEGEVDAVVTSEPWQSRLLNTGAEKLFDSSMIPGELCRLLVVRGDALRSRRREVQGLVDAHFAVLGDMTHGLDSREREVIARREQLSWDAFENTRRLISSPTRAEGLRMMEGVPSGLDAMAERVADFMVRSGLMPGRPGRSDWIDTSFVEESP
jgi:NitT/TauT family transport system substrate-binding protein